MCNNLCNYEFWAFCLQGCKQVNNYSWPSKLQTESSSTGGQWCVFSMVADSIRGVFHHMYIKPREINLNLSWAQNKVVTLDLDHDPAKNQLKHLSIECGGWWTKRSRKHWFSRVKSSLGRCFIMPTLKVR